MLSPSHTHIEESSTRISRHRFEEKSDTAHEQIVRAHIESPSAAEKRCTDINKARLDMKVSEIEQRRAEHEGEFGLKRRRVELDEHLRALDERRLELEAEER